MSLERWALDPENHWPNRPEAIDPEGYDKPVNRGRFTAKIPLYRGRVCNMCFKIFCRCGGAA